MKQTSKSLVTTLGFLVVAGAIAGAAFWVQKDVTKEETKKEKAAKVFDGLDRTKVREIRVTKEGKLLAAATRPDDKASWKLRDPIPAEADATQIDPMLTALAHLPPESDTGEGAPQQPRHHPPRRGATLTRDDATAPPLP